MTARQSIRKYSRLISNMGRSVYRDRASMSNTTVLLSSGRSGSTWLGSILQSLPSSRTIFEPFRPKNGIAQLCDYRYTYFETDSDSPQLATAMEQMLRGQLRTPWTDQFNPVFKMTYNRRLLKAVRINLLFPWMSRYFPDCKYILMLRHPAAVIASQLREGWDLDGHRLLGQTGISDALGLDLTPGQKFAGSNFEKNLLFWAIENGVALKNATETGALIISYEDLCLAPQEQLAKIEQFLGVSFPADIHEQLNRTSWSSQKGVGQLDAEKKISGWTENTTDYQVQAIEEAMSICGMTGLYGRDVMPNWDALIRASQ